MPSYNREATTRFTRTTLALILAGGRGSRLRSFTSHRVKPAVPFGGEFRLIDFPLSNCINSGIRHIGVLTQYKAQSLIRHIQSGWSFLHGEFGEYIELMPAQQRTGSSWYQGTADAVYQNLDIIKSQASNWVLILGGDHVYKMDYATFLRFHVGSGADVTVGCVEVPRELAHSFGILETDANDRILAFKEKPATTELDLNATTPVLASMGIYVFNKDYLVAVLEEDAQDPDSAHDFGKNVLPKALARDDRLYAFRFRDIDGDRGGYWRDIGDLDAYWQANLELVSVTPPLNLYDRTWPIWTYQLQAPPSKFVFDDDGRRGTAIDSLVANGCVVSGAQVRRSVLFPYVHVDEGSVVEQSVVLPNVTIGKHCVIRNVVIGTGCHIDDGSIIGDNGGVDGHPFEVSPGGITLVTLEMLNQERWCGA